MKKDAETHATEDKQKQELIEARNIADTMIYTTEKMMKDVEEKKIVITDEEKKAVEIGLLAVKDVKDKDDVEAIKKIAEELSKAAQAVGMKMYSASQDKNSANGSPAGGPTDDPNAEKKEDKKDEGPIEGEVVN